MRRITLASLFLFITVSVAIPKLGEVFQVDMRDPSLHYSSCARKVQGSVANSPPIFEPNAAAGDDSHLLNKMWIQLNKLNSHALDLTTRDKYNGDPATQKLMEAIYGIIADGEPGQGERTVPNGLHGLKYDDVRRKFRGVQNLIEKTQANSRHKPKIFCDTTYYVFQTGYEPARDTNGNERREADGRIINLMNWEYRNGRDFDRLWYFWFSFAGEHGYMIFSKDSYPPLSSRENIPFPLDPRTKQPSWCMLEGGRDGWTWSPEGLPEGWVPGTTAYVQTPHVALCPVSNTEFSMRHHDMNLQPQPIGTRLDNVGITALTLYHELFHVVWPPPAMADQDAWYPKRQPDGKPVPGWPTKKSAFRWSNVQTWGGIQCLSLGLYAKAAEEITNLHDMGELKNPESFVWFAWTLYLTNFANGGGQDWSTGAARPKGSPPAPMTATIPAEPPGDRGRRFVSDATDVPMRVESLEDLSRLGLGVSDISTTLAEMYESATMHEWRLLQYHLHHLNEVAVEGALR